MPYEITWERRGVYRRYFGRLTDAEFIGAVVEVEGSPRFYDIRYAILDFLEMEEFVVRNESFLEETAALNFAAAMSNPNIKVAVVAVSPVVLRLAEQYKAHALRPYTTEVFSTLAEARTWVVVADPLKYRYRGALR